MDKRLMYAYWLHCVPGIGNATAGRLLEYAQTEENIYFLKEERLRELLKPSQAASFLKRRRELPCEKLYEQLLEKGISFCPYFSKDYPQKLLAIPDRPYAVYTKGRLPALEQAVAVIGARECSPYGSFMAGEYGRAFAAAGVTVVSGMARGIDGISQRAALRAGGKSVSVLGCGVDVCYPESNREIYDFCERQGALLSEYPPGTAPLPRNFPPRNRIISGLAELVLVIEAREKSGTFITVDMALEQGREVFALPGRTTDELSCGCNRLIGQGAGIALSADDVLSFLGRRREESASAREREELTRLEEQLLQITDWYPTPFSELYERLRTRPGLSRISPSQAQQAMIGMLMKGVVGEKGKNHYYRRK